MPISKKQQARLDSLMPGSIPRYVRIYDNGGRTIDRYTVVFHGRNPRWEHPAATGWGSFSYPVLSMSGSPLYPGGVCQLSEYNRFIDRPRYGHLGRKIKFQDLNPDCQRVVLNDYLDFWELPKESDVA